MAKVKVKRCPQCRIAKIPKYLDVCGRCYEERGPDCLPKKCKGCKKLSELERCEGCLKKDEVIAAWGTGKYPTHDEILELIRKSKLED